MQLLTIEEASEVLRLSRSTIYTYVAREAIPYAKIGSHVRFNADELEKWVSERSHGKLSAIADTSHENGVPVNKNG